MSESNLQSKVINFFNSKEGFMAINNHGLAYSGRAWPDILLHFNGCSAYIETKRPGNTARRAQEVRHGEIQSKCKVPCFVIDNMVDIAELYKKLCMFKRTMENGDGG